ncbi:MAG: hypothetical protein KatS3mg115_2233 [Candidatus Poribacteria bacterium]|nr:MAG: hypothetical protein KatS3mg115_2233 [Candidatus Poribacteria bacterium]
MQTLHRVWVLPLLLDRALTIEIKYFTNFPPARRWVVPEQRIFFSWIGKTDLRPLAERLPEDRREEFCRLMEGKLPPLTGTTGPVQTVLAQAGPFKAGAPTEHLSGLAER